MSGGDCHIYIAWDRDDPPGTPPELVGTIAETPAARDEAMFINSHTDPVLGEMIYPLMPDEWRYFALFQDLDSARFITYLGVDRARLFFYLSYPAED